VAVAEVEQAVPDWSLRVTTGGLLRVGAANVGANVAAKVAAKVAAETKLDGKHLLRASDPHLTREDIALGYKLLLGIGTRTVTTRLTLS
jgi:hypothetical protein